VLRIGSEEYAVLSFSAFDGYSCDNHREHLPDCLTSNERSIVSLVLRGKTNLAIARQRGTSPRTIANQLGRIYQKLGVHSRRELRVRIARDAKEPT
jgi:DNA-binding NarL/FixJ family response regulator